FEKFLDPVFEPLPIPHGPEAEYSHLAEAGMAAASVAIALIGFGLAYSKYCKRSWEQQREIRQYGSLYPVFLNKYYVDEGYDFLFVNRAKDAGTGLWKCDAVVVDGAVNGSACTIVGFVISIPLWVWFDRDTADQMQFVQNIPWIQTIGANYHVGIDGISLLLVMLTTLLGPLAVLSSWEAIHDRVKEYYVFMLMLQ